MKVCCKAMLMLILLTSFVLFGAEKRVSVITLPDYAPFGYLESGDTHVVEVPPGEDSPKFKGYAWDVVRESFHAMGYTVELWVVPWARALTYLTLGEVDLIFPVSVTESRKNIFRYSAEYVNRVFYRVYVLKEQSIDWDSLSSLNGLMIAQMRGFNYGEQWTDSTEIRKYDVGEIIQGLEMLRNKRVHGFVGYEGVWDIVLQQNQIQDEITKLPMFDSNKEYIAASRGNPMGRKILEQFDLGRKKIARNGELNRIKEKWSHLISPIDSTHITPHNQKTQ